MSAKTTQAPQRERRKFFLSQSALRHIIKSQSGSLGKAILEAVANGMDAGSTRIDIDVSATHVCIKDNGHGIPTAADLEAVFDTFGFEHHDGDREHGRFGIGRGQMFCFGVNTWRTSTFQMNVDLTAGSDMDYELLSGLPKVKGTSIDIKLYDVLDVEAVYRLEDEIKALVKYAVVPVHYNGKRISTDPRQEKWTEETDEAWFKLKPSGYLAYYSQGLYVTQEWHRGIGGIVVTKPGHAFALNMARNDILKKECQVFPAVDKYLRSASRKQLKESGASHTMDAQQRRALTMQALAGEDVDAFMSQPVLTLANGKHISPSQMLKLGRPVALAEAGNVAADRLLQRKAVTVVSSETLDCWGVDSVAGLRTRMAEMLQRQIERDQRSWHRQEDLKKLQKLKMHEDIKPFKDLVNLEFREVPAKELSKTERSALAALRYGAKSVPWCFYGDASEGSRRTQRSIRVMESEVAVGMTDGCGLIWIDRKELKKLNQGFRGFSDVMATVVHEYTHNTSSQGSHLHGQDFYETFHDAIGRGAQAHAAVSGYGYFVKHGGPPNSSQLKDIGLLYDNSENVPLFQRDFEEPVDEEPVGLKP